MSAEEFLIENNIIWNEMRKEIEWMKLKKIQKKSRIKENKMEKENENKLNLKHQMQ